MTKGGPHILAQIVVEHETQPLLLQKVQIVLIKVMGDKGGWKVGQGFKRFQHRLVPAAHGIDPGDIPIGLNDICDLFGRTGIQAAAAARICKDDVWPEQCKFGPKPEIALFLTLKAVLAEGREYARR